MRNRTIATPTRESSPSLGVSAVKERLVEKGLDSARGGNQAHLRLLMARSASTPTQRDAGDVIRRQTAPQAASQPGPTWQPKEIGAGIQLTPGTCFSEITTDGTVTSE